MPIDRPLAAPGIALAFPKASAALRDPVGAALHEAVADGAYAAAPAKHEIAENFAASEIAATAGSR